jgi:hypothetical protein
MPWLFVLSCMMNAKGALCRTHYHLVGVIAVLPWFPKLRATIHDKPDTGW